MGIYDGLPVQQPKQLSEDNWLKIRLFVIISIINMNMITYIIINIKYKLYININVIYQFEMIN